MEGESFQESSLEVCNSNHSSKIQQVYSESAYNWLLKIPPQHWARSHFTVYHYPNQWYEHVDQVFRRMDSHHSSKSTLQSEGLERKEEKMPKKFQMSKNGKLSRKLRSMVCKKCGTMGHNKRSCKQVGSNQGGGVQSQSSQANPTSSQVAGGASQSAGGPSVGARVQVKLEVVHVSLVQLWEDQLNNVLVLDQVPSTLCTVQVVKVVGSKASRNVI